MSCLWLTVWLACGGGAPPAPSIALPEAYAQVTLPLAGAELKKDEGREIVLSYPNARVSELIVRWAETLHGTGWDVADAETGPGFTRVVGRKEGRSIEVFLVKQPNRAEAHVTLYDGEPE